MAKILKFPNQPSIEECKALASNDNAEKPGLNFIEASGVIREKFMQVLGYAGEKPSDMVITPFISEYNKDMEISVSFDKSSRASLDVMRKYKNLANQMGFAAPSFVAFNRENSSRKQKKR